METRQLALFVLACQYVSHAEAAAEYGISPSAVSEAISALEADLKLVLFLRGPLGHAPTEAARWLFQRVEPMLQLLEVATAPADVPSIHYLTVSCALHFSFGKLSRVLASAARALRQDYPGTVSQISFQSEQVYGQHRRSDLFLAYSARQEDLAPTLFDDDWVVVTAAPLPTATASLADLSRFQRLLLPPLPVVLKLALRGYCERHGLPQPFNLPLDTNLFEVLQKQTEQVAVLAPRSLVAGGAVRQMFSVQALEPSLVTPVVAHITTEDPNRRHLVDAFLVILQRILQGPPPKLLYDPKVSVRQMRMVATLSKYQNMSSAARALHIAQPALSVQLKKLEHVVGVTMFARHHGGMTLLSEARPRAVLFEHALEIANDIRVGAVERKNHEGHDLYIGTTALVGEMKIFRHALTKAIAKLSLEYPSCHIHVIQMPGPALQHELRSKRLDLLVSEQAGLPKAGHHLGAAGVVGVAYFGADVASPASAVDVLRSHQVVLAPSDSVLRNCTEQFGDTNQLVSLKAIEIDSPCLSFSVARELKWATVLPKNLFCELAGEGADGFQAFKPETMITIALEALDNRNLTAVEQAFTQHLRSYLVRTAASGFVMASF